MFLLQIHYWKPAQGSSSDAALRLLTPSSSRHPVGSRPVPGISTNSVTNGGPDLRHRPCPTRATDLPQTPATRCAIKTAADFTTQLPTNLPQIRTQLRQDLPQTSPHNLRQGPSQTSSGNLRQDLPQTSSGNLRQDMSADRQAICDRICHRLRQAICQRSSRRPPPSSAWTWPQIFPGSATQFARRIRRSPPPPPHAVILNKVKDLRLPFHAHPAPDITWKTISNHGDKTTASACHPEASRWAQRRNFA